MTDFEIFVERLRYCSEDNASTWDLLRFFHESGFDPALTTRVLCASRATEIRVDAAGFFRDKGDPNRKITVITDKELEKIEELIRSDTEIVTLPVTEQDRANLRVAPLENSAPSDDRALLRAVATAYIVARPSIAGALNLTWLQNHVRSKVGSPLFSIGIFSWDVRDFLTESSWSERVSEPFFVPSVMKSIDEIILENNK